MYDLVFYHIPKCGGTSIRNYIGKIFLKKNYPVDNIYISKVSNGLKDLMSEKDIESMKDVLKNKKVILSHINNKLHMLLKSKINITCIRNPINRLVSSFNHFTLLNDNSKTLTDIYLNDKASFDKLCQNIYNNKIWMREIHDYDYIIIFENLENDLIQIKNKLQVNDAIPIDHQDPGKMNKTNKNYFKWDFENSTHVDMYEYIKVRLKEDIDKYNKICEIKNLRDLIIK